MRRTFSLLACLTLFITAAMAERTERLLRHDWRFHLGDVAEAAQPSFDDSRWQEVTVPHDWAIAGPFSREFDLQKVAVTQNGEKVATWKTGRTGGLPYVGVGWYRTSFTLAPSGMTNDELRMTNDELRMTNKGNLSGSSDSKSNSSLDIRHSSLKNSSVTLIFDGAMSEAHVYVNGREATFWPYGYNSFYVDITDFVHADGQPNTLAVRLENRDQSSRWYCGAGLYRNVHLVQTSKLHVATWGTQVTTQLFGGANGDFGMTNDELRMTNKSNLSGSTDSKSNSSFVIRHSSFDKGDSSFVIRHSSFDKSDSSSVIRHSSSPFASVTLKTTLENAEGKTLRLHTVIIGPDGRPVAEKENTQTIAHGHPFIQNFIVGQPLLWSPETPYLYKAVTRVFDGEQLLDTYQTVFGIRTIDVVPDRGFFLNGYPRKFQGVCNHHDLGPLGAAINRAALRRQLTLLKDMGCDAIRTSHNMPAPELVELCDSMGFMMMLEPFDEWDIAKCRNGYHRYFKEWAERDMVNMLCHYRNHPSVVLWSVGNEVPTQCSADGYRVASFLQDICHREDPTRPVTCGMDQVSCVLGNGFAALLDIPGFNYRAHRYEEAYAKLPQNIVLGSETSSTVSSRGVYKLPVKLKADATYPDHQSSGYDVEYCGWSNVPDVDFANADDHEWEIGQFVWTGFDYLGEPSPYDTDAWPSHSSMFGIIDLASLPKDRFYLYRSLWNRREHTLHILPHWTWPGREGQVVPVFVYTDAPEAELFVNGKSQGVQHKYTKAESDQAKADGDPFWLLRRYRLIWEDVIYEPGELKVVAQGVAPLEMKSEESRFARSEESKLLSKPESNSHSSLFTLHSSLLSASVRTAGKAHHLELIPDRTLLQADGDDLCYVTVRVVDKDGNLVPDAADLVSFRVKGAGRFRAAANGDAANLDLFHLPRHHAFAGQLTAILQAADTQGTITLEASAKGLKKATLTVQVQ